MFEEFERKNEAKKYSGPNRRLTQRLPIDVAIKLVVFGKMAVPGLSEEDAVKVRAGIIGDISCGGVSIKTNELDDRWHANLLNGHIVLAIKFVLPGAARPTRATARTIWLKLGAGKSSYRYTLGTVFSEIDLVDRHAIEHFTAGDAHQQSEPQQE